MEHPIPALHDLQAAYLTIDRLIEHYGSVSQPSLGQEGWTGLHLAKDVMKQAMQDRRRADGIDAEIAGLWPREI